MPSGDTPDLNLLFPQRMVAPEQKLFGRYTLKRVLGRGGMGIVWMAHDDELHRHVAMKFLPDMLIRDREAVNDLKRETRRSLDLTHHHIVRIYDFTQDDVCAAIIMEYVDGETLSAMKTQQSGGCFSVPSVAAWVAHFCQALDYAHRQARVVHRDLKPANLMVNSRGDLKVTDFGISRSMSDSMTRVSMSNTAGTLAYMSPEQALGAPPAACDDVYAFGATIYDLLTGRPPFFRGNIQVQLETVIPPKMAARRDELGNQGDPIPDVWEETIAACLAKRPNDRPQTMGEIAAMLGLGVASGSLRTTFSTGYASGTGATTPATTSTRAKTSGTEDAVTRTDSVPPVPQTTRPANNGTRGTSFVSTPRPTALRDVIPGYADEPVEAPSAKTAPPSEIPGTKPPEAKAEPESAPLPPEAPVPIEPESEPASDRSAAEAPAQIEVPADPVSAEVPVEEPPAISEPDLPIEEPPPAALETPSVPEAIVEEIEPVAELPAPAVLPVPVEDEAGVEIAEPPELEVSPPVVEPAESTPRPREEFPTLFGEPPVESGVPAAEEIPTIDLPSEQSGVEEPEEVASASDEEIAPAAVDEAAATLVEAPRPEPIQIAPIAAIPPAPAVPKRETLRPFSPPTNEPDSAPQRRRPIPWVPIAIAAGLAVIAGIWSGMPKKETEPLQPGNSNTSPRPAEPTPVPIVTESETKLQRARTLMSNEEFPEAIALLKSVQQLEPGNAQAANLMAEISRIQEEQAAKAAMAQRQEQIDALFKQASMAADREQWTEMRAALEKVLQLDPQNASAIAQLNNLKDAQDEWGRVAEQQRQQKEAEDREREQERQRQLAAMQQQQQRQAAEDEPRNARERPRTTLRDETPPKRPKATPRPQRNREEDENTNDRPPRRTVANNENERPPAVVRPQPQPQRRPAATPRPAAATPSRKVWGTAPGG